MTTRMDTLEEVRAFLEGTRQVDFKAFNRQEGGVWIAAMLVQFRTARLRKKERGLVRRYL